MTITGIPNCLNYCESLTVYTQFINVSTGHIIQLGRLEFGDPWCMWSKISKKV